MEKRIYKIGDTVIIKLSKDSRKEWCYCKEMKKLNDNVYLIEKIVHINNKVHYELENCKYYWNANMLEFVKIPQEQINKKMIESLVMGFAKIIRTNHNLIEILKEVCKNDMNNILTEYPQITIGDVLNDKYATPTIENDKEVMMKVINKLSEALAR